MTYLKFGFHLGPGGNAQGHNTFINALDAAGIPFFVKSADAMPFYAQELAQKSSQDNTVVYRRSVPAEGTKPPSGNPDVPDYNKSPRDAAIEHWQWHKAHFPPELDPAITWVETINEPDKNRAEWLAAFAIETAMLAMADGYKWSAFGWATGEPEIVDWEGPVMLQFLRLCALFPDKLAIALHEYSLTTQNIWNKDGWLVGRFRFLYEVCDQQGIPRPTVHISEWGWTHNNVPHADKAMPDYESVGALYAQFPQVKGAATWYLGPGWEDIANRAQKLILPLQELTLKTRYPDPEPPQICQGLPREKYDRNYWVLPQDTVEDAYIVVAATAFAVKRTFGFSYDDAGLGALENKTAVLYDIPLSEQHVFVDWYAAHYPCTAVVFRDLPTIPPPHVANIGLHASADPGDLYGGEAEFQEFKVLQPGVIKVLSAHSEASVKRLAKAHPNVQWIIRAFLSMNGRSVTPQQFYDWTINDLSRAINTLRAEGVAYANMWIEIHNEPNLVVEGWTTSWQNGRQFADWLKTVRALYQQKFPNARTLYPGLSPGGDVPGVRMDSSRFIAESETAVTACDAVGIHCYWSQTWPMSTAFAYLDSYQRFNKSAWVTESSRNDPVPQVSWSQYATEYTDFWRGLNMRPWVKGVTYFVASALEASFQAECWVVNQQSRGIAARIRADMSR